MLVALSKVIGGHDDAIAYVREHYCKEAVETKSQVDFLMKHFGVKTATPASFYGRAIDSLARHFRLQ